MVGPITLVGSGVDGLRGLPCGIARHGTASTQRMVRPFVAREFRRVGGRDLASMYPAFDLSVLLRAITGFSARAISLRKAREPFGSPVFARREASNPRISLSSSVIRARGYAVRSLRPCRIEFSVHTGMPREPSQKWRARVGALVAKASKQASVAQHILPVRAGERVRVAAKTAARQWESRAQRRRLFIWRPPPLRIDTKVDLNCTKGRMTTAARSA